MVAKLPLRWDASAQAWLVQQWLAGRTQGDIAEELGYATGSRISAAIKDFCDNWSEYDVARDMIYDAARKRCARVALQNYLTTGVITYPTPTNALVLPATNAMVEGYTPGAYYRARQEHAWLLRAEGMLYTDIARRLEVSHERARQMVKQFGRRVQQAWHRTRISVSCLRATHDRDA